MFIPGIDEMAINAEIGLYFDFNVTEHGFPTGCPGFERFDDNWAEKGWTWTTTEESHWWKADPDCQFNKMQEPAGSTPLHQLFEDYAKDGDAWMADFVPAMDKMLSNGYSEDELVDSGYNQNDYVCNRDEPQIANNRWISFVNCYNPTKTMGIPELYFEYFTFLDFSFLYQFQKVQSLLFIVNLMTESLKLETMIDL